ncbi:MAG: hypothetical protein H6710_09345 [Myxococcales bacterium]|nr:hypothetical protein [Myxococcales bacterium]
MDRGRPRLPDDPAGGRLASARRPPPRQRPRPRPPRRSLAGPARPPGARRPRRSGRRRPARPRGPPAPDDHRPRRRRPLGPTLRREWGRARSRLRAPGRRSALHRPRLRARGRRPSFDLLDAPGLEVSDRRARCPRRGGAFTCKSGELRPRFAEIAYAPRRCLLLDLEDGAEATLRIADAELGARLRGHLGFADFNARLRSDAPLLLRIAVDGEPLADLVFSDRQGWAAFEVPTPPGRHELVFTAIPTLAGTFGDQGYRPRPAHSACLEARALAAGGAGG